MILPFPREFAEDAAERSVVDVAQARRLLASLAPGLSAALARRRLALAPLIGTGDLARVERAEAAVELAYARLAVRHGSWGRISMPTTTNTTFWKFSTAASRG